MSARKFIIVTIFVIIFTTIVKAHFLLLRLLLLVLLGLLGLYVLNRLSHRMGMGMSGGGNGHRIMSGLQMMTKLLRSRRSTEYLLSKPKEISGVSDYSYTLDDVLKYDEIACARKFICSISSDSVKNSSTLLDNDKSLHNILQILRNDMPSKKTRAIYVLKEAEKLGRISQNNTICNLAFKPCYYTQKQLIKYYSDFSSYVI